MPFRSPASPVLLRATSTRLWELFHSDPTRRGQEPMEHELLLRWARAHEQMDRRRNGSDGESTEVFPEDLSRRRRRLAPLWVEGRETLADAMDELSTEGATLAIADRDGILLRCLGGGRSANQLWDLQAREGADWSEGVRGTNAIGTCLAEGRPVAVEGSAHLDQRYHKLASYAAPLREEDSRAFGAVAILTSNETSRGDLLAWAISIARQLERNFLEPTRGGSRDVLLSRVREIADRCPIPALVIVPPGRLASANRSASSLLGLQDGFDSLPIREILGLGWQELVSTSRDPGVDAVAHLPGGEGPERNKTPASVRLRLQPILDGSETLLAILAFLEGTRPLAGETETKTFLDIGNWPASGEGPFARIFGRDDRLRAAIESASRFAPTTLPVLLLAETGTGKDLMARAVHDASSRAQGPFVPLNCGSLSPHLLESELFGYEPGAFTGASPKGRDGKIAAAEGGTLFLDEVAEMPAPLQALLLRVLEDGTYYRVGGNQPRKADVRLICATCRSLPELVAEGGFRKDLYYRIKGACLSLPPLRERTDVGELTLYLLSRLTEELFPGTYPRIDPEAFDWIQRNSWPGNVRELKTSLHHAAVLARGTIRMEHLPSDLVGMAATAVPEPTSPSSRELALREVESVTLKQAIETSGGNLSRAAQTLGIARTTLYRKMKRYGLRPG